MKTKKEKEYFKRAIYASKFVMPSGFDTESLIRYSNEIYDFILELSNSYETTDVFTALQLASSKTLKRRDSDDFKHDIREILIALT